MPYILCVHLWDALLDQLHFALEPPAFDGTHATFIWGCRGIETYLHYDMWLGGE